MDNSDLIEDQEFTCPECGSHTFGSSEHHGESMQGHCHGHGCKFSWPRQDDAKYFRGRGTFHPHYAIGQQVK